jgi:hypothetical protein
MQSASATPMNAADVRRRIEVVMSKEAEAARISKKSSAPVDFLVPRST